jgi:hypothetical protein
VKVIFLDIDGVCNSIDWMIKSAGTFDNNQIDPATVVRLNQITDATGAVIVVSSVWRILPTFDQLQRILKAYGITGEVFSATPENVASGEGSREKEILAWLDTNEAESFVVIDDEHMFKLKPYHVQTTMQSGLLDEHVTQAIEILKGL